MKSITSIDKFKEGDSIQGFFLCFEKHIRHSRNGDLFIDLRLRDKTGSINAKIWDNVNELKKKFESVKHAKPAASRTESSEVYVVAQGYHGVGGNH